MFFLSEMHLTMSTPFEMFLNMFILGCFQIYSLYLGCLWTCSLTQDVSEYVHSVCDVSEHVHSHFWPCPFPLGCFWTYGGQLHSVLRISLNYSSFKWRATSPARKFTGKQDHNFVLQSFTIWQFSFWFATTTKNKQTNKQKTKTQKSESPGHNIIKWQQSLTCT